MRFRRLPVPYVQQLLRDMLSIQPFRTKRFLPQSYLLKALTFGLPFHLSPSCESQQNDAEGGRTERDQEAATAWGNANDDKRPARLLQAWVCVRKGNAEVKCTSVEVRLREHNCAVDVSRRHYDRAVTAVTTHGVAARTAGDTTPCTSSTAERAGGSPPLHLQQPRQTEVPIGALPPVSLQQPKQPEVPPPAHLQQAKPLQMQAPTRGPWTVPRPPKRNVNYYTEKQNPKSRQGDGGERTTCLAP